MISGTADRIEVRRPGDVRRGTAPVVAGVDAEMATNGAATVTDTRAHVAALDVMSSARAGAHVGGLDVMSSARAGAHVGGPGGNPVTSAGAHVGGPGGNPVTSAGAHVGVGSKLEAAILRTEAKAALTGLGWKSAIAHAAVVAAAAAQGEGGTLDRLIFEALRRCRAIKA